MKKQADTEERIKKIIADHFTMVVATATPEGIPHAATVFYASDDSFHFYFATGMESQKYKNIYQNSHVAFTIGTGPEVVTVQGEGVAHLLAEGQDDIVALLAERFELHRSPHWPIWSLPHKGVAIMKISPARLTLLTLGPDNAGDEADRTFHTLSLP